MDKSQNTIRARLTLKDAFSIPNIMSYIRILLIPVFMIVYIKYDNSLLALILIIISSMTDVLDGIVARKFNMVTDWGKLVDPLADKLTQFCIMISLITKFPYFLWLAIIILVKEVVSLAYGYYVFHETGVVKSADWHGKLSTCLLVGTFMAHFIWPKMDTSISYILVIACGGMMVLSFALYLIRYGKTLKEGRKSEHEQ